MEEKRLIFKCWQCEREYSLLRNLTGKPKLALECPYCGADGIADLDPYRDKSVELFKSGSAEKADLGTAYNLPDVIPTRQPES